MRNQIPNAITILSLLLSCLAIILTFEGKIAIAAYLLIGSCICDFLDGFAARALKVNNPIGKEIDSLVDMIAFGVAPAMLMYQITKMAQETQQIQLLINFPWIHYIVFVIPAFSAIRLAIFNIDTRQSTSFIGLAVPAHASFYIFCSLLFVYPDLPMLINASSFVTSIVSNPIIMLASTILLSIMLVVEVPMFSLKFKNLKWKDNKLPFTFVLIWLGMLIFMNIVAMPMIILFYILWSIVLSIKNNSNSISV
jgi:CDP-diacylglycerol--serine O-phosphatidyltransferase